MVSSSDVVDAGKWAAALLMVNALARLVRPL